MLVETVNTMKKTVNALNVAATSAANPEGPTELQEPARGKSNVQNVISSSSGQSDIRK